MRSRAVRLTGTVDRSRPTRRVVGFGLSSLFLLAVPLVAQAQGNALEKTVSFIISETVYPVVQLLGKLLISFINILIQVAQYNGFIQADAVQKGFIIVRDIANLFFIVILLIIAVGTILNIQQYRYNRLLGRLVIMAVLVNFALVISGLLIDAAQVVMLTFVNAFRDAAAGNLTTAFGLDNLLALRDAAEPISGYAIVGALLLALALLIIALFTVGAYVVVLLVRIVALWFLLVLSPLAYVLRAFPAGQPYAAEWWNLFSKYLICGPVVAFFLWLSLSVVASSTEPLSLSVLQGRSIGGESATDPSALPIKEQQAGLLASTISRISETDQLLSYMIAILLLLGSLAVAQRLCGAAGRFAGQMATRARRAAMFATGVTAGVAAYRFGAGKVGEGWVRTKGAVRTGFATAYQATIGRGLQRIVQGVGRGRGKAAEAAGRIPKVGGAARAVTTFPGRAGRGIRDWFRVGAAEYQMGKQLTKEERERRQREIEARGREYVEKQRGLPPIPLVLLEKKRRDAEAVSKLTPLKKEDLFKILKHAWTMAGDEGHRQRSAAIRVAFTKKYLDDFVKIEKGSSNFNDKFDFINEYLKTETTEGLEILGELTELAKAEKRADWAGHLKEEEGVLKKLDNAVEGFDETVHYLGTLEPGDALRAMVSLIPTVKAKPISPATGQPDEQARDVTKTSRWNADIVRALQTGLRGQRVDQLRGSMKVQDAERLLGVSRQEIDQETGVLHVTKATAENIRTLFKEKPDAAMVAWEKLAPAKHRDSFRIREHDETKNYEPVTPTPLEVDMSWWTKQRGENMPKTVDINNPPTEPKAEEKTSHEGGSSAGAAAAAAGVAGLAAGAAVAGGAGKTPTTSGPEGRPAVRDAVADKIDRMLGERRPRQGGGGPEEPPTGPGGRQPGGPEGGGGGLPVSGGPTTGPSAGGVVTPEATRERAAEVHENLPQAIDKRAAELNAVRESGDAGREAQLEREIAERTQVLTAAQQLEQEGQPAVPAPAAPTPAETTTAAAAGGAITVALGDPERPELLESAFAEFSDRLGQLDQSLDAVRATLNQFSQLVPELEKRYGREKPTGLAEPLDELKRLVAQPPEGARLFGDIVGAERDRHIRLLTERLSELLNQLRRPNALPVPPPRAQPPASPQNRIP